jgi:hypothetical protein
MVKNKGKAVYLYDILPPVIIGPLLVVILAINFIWNFVVLIITLLFIKRLKAIGWRRILANNIPITIGGALIDIIAVFLFPLLFTYISGLNTGVWTMLQIFSGMIMLMIFNYLVGKKIFKLSDKEAMILGIVMGIFTAPWGLLVFLGYFK